MINRGAVLAMLTFFLAGCSCGKRACNPSAFTSRCDGDVMEFCLSERAYGIDFGSHVQRTPCGEGNVCHDFGTNQLGCAHPPLTRCEPETFTPTCDGARRLGCFSPSSFVTENWVVAMQACPAGTSCKAGGCAK